MKKKEESEREGVYIPEKLLSATLITHLCYPDFVLSGGTSDSLPITLPRCLVAGVAGDPE